MSKWQKILMAIFAAAAAVLPYFVTSKEGQGKVGAIEGAAGAAIDEISKAG